MSVNFDDFINSQIVNCDLHIFRSDLVLEHHLWNADSTLCDPIKSVPRIEYTTVLLTCYEGSNF